MAGRSGLEVDARAFAVAAQEALEGYRAEALQLQRQRAERVKNSARQHARRARVHDPREPVLADSIEITEGSDADGPYVAVGTSVRHGLFQEFGTSEMAAHPFMRPAIAEEAANG